MFFQKTTLLLAITAAVASAMTTPLSAGSYGELMRRANNTATCLTAQEINQGSKTDGLAPEEDPDVDQTPSLTDNANFLKFCDGKTLTSGQQNLDGSCNPIPMGDIPSINNMISAVMLEPKNGQVLGKNESFTIRVQTQGLTAGSFTNPDFTYYTAPQQLDDNGNIIGHAHVTVQDMGSADPTTPPDPQAFAFFLGINDAGDGQGQLSAPVDTGLLPGNYRVCTMIAAMNHQPVTMPKAQRGAQDDCVRFTVVDGQANATRVMF